MAKTIVQYKIDGWLEKSEETSTVIVLNEIIDRLEKAQLVSVLPYQKSYEHSCSISPDENNSFVDIVTRLPSHCISDPFKSEEVIKNFVREALDSAMLTLEQQLHCPKENFYVIEANDGDN